MGSLKFHAVPCPGMAQGHWLDPLARQVLRITGQLTNQNSKSKQGNIPSWAVDVNRATSDDWLLLPGCTETMAELLTKLQQGGVQLTGTDDLFQLLELPQDLAEQWRPHLVFRWYGDPPPQPSLPPIDLNVAAPAMLQQTLNWPEARLERLIRERQRRPFHNLADLQERLSLPPLAVEQLIGYVRFGPKPTGPKLPPSG